MSQYTDTVTPKSTGIPSSGGLFKDDNELYVKHNYLASTTKKVVPDSTTIDIDSPDSNVFGLSSDGAQTLEDARLMIQRSSWIHTFFLIIADILAPTSSPYAISTLGYVPGSLLYFGYGTYTVIVIFCIDRLLCRY